MSWSNKLLFFLLVVVLASCKDKLPPGDEGRILGRWEEVGGTFNETDSISYFQWYEFMQEGKANSYVGEFTYKLDTITKKLAATSHMIGTDGYTVYKQPFFEKTYTIKKDTLIFSFTSRTNGKYFEIHLLKKKE